MMRSPFDRLMIRVLNGWFEWKSAGQCQKRRETMLRASDDLRKAARNYERGSKRHGRTRAAIAAMQRATTEALRGGLHNG